MEQDTMEQKTTTMKPILPKKEAGSVEHQHKKEKKEKVIKQKKTNILLNMLGLIAIGAGLYWIANLFFHFGKVEYTNDAQVEQFITPINTRVGGYIKEIRFLEHQPVKKGDTLLIIDDGELKIQLEQAEAAYQDALASRHVTTSSVNTVRNNLSVSDANIEEAKVRMWNAEQNFNRYNNLLKEDVVTGQQFDAVKTEYQAAKARFEALQRQKQTTQLSTQEVSSHLGVNDAAIKRTVALLDMAKLNLKYTVITAPYDGVVGRRTIQEGQLIQPGQSLVSIVRGSQVWVVANFKETQMANLHIGQEIVIKVDALKGETFKGKLTAISEATGAKYSAVPVDNATGNFVKVQQRIPVRIEFTNDNTKKDLELLRAGMNVEAEAKL